MNRRIDLIAKLVADCGLRLNGIRPDATRIGPRFETVLIYLTETGNYRTSVALLHKLRQTFPDTTITSLELSADPTDVATANFRIELLWYATPDSDKPTGD